MAINWLDRCLVEAPFHYTLVTTERKYHKVLDRLNVPRNERPAFIKTSWSNATAHSFTSNGKLTFVICVSGTEEHTTAQVYALLVHEAVHMWQEARARIGEIAPSQEFEAYAIQALSQRLFEEYAQQR